MCVLRRTVGHEASLNLGINLQKLHPQPPQNYHLTIPRIPCYLRRQAQNFTPLNFGTDPI
jgi:hypothetical protein